MSLLNVPLKTDNVYKKKKVMNCFKDTERERERERDQQRRCKKK